MVRQKLGLLIKKLTGNSWSFMLVVQINSNLNRAHHMPQIKGEGRERSRLIIQGLSN